MTKLQELFLSSSKPSKLTMVGVATVATLSFVAGCQSGLYQVSTSEDDKKIDESLQYYEVSSADLFIKDNGASPDGLLYDEDKMPVQVIKGRSETHKDKDTLEWTGVLWFFTLGIFPLYDCEYMTQDITVKTPIGEKSGSYRVDAKRWGGWIPIFIGYPGFAEKRDSNAELPNHRLEKVGQDRLVNNLAGQFSYPEYSSFAKAKNDERKKEVARIKAVSEKVDGLLANNRFNDASNLINKESQSSSVSRECDEGLWSAMRDRVSKAHEEFDTKHVKALIASGKYEEAIAFCDGENKLSETVKTELRTEAIDKGFAKLKSDVASQVEDYIAKNKFAEAEALIAKESKSLVATKTSGFGNPLAEISERVQAARQDADKKRVESLISTGKFEDALALCNSKNSLTSEMNNDLKNEAVTKAAKELNDATRLIAFLKLIKDGGMRDDVVMKLKSLNSLSKLTSDQLVEVANTSEREEVVLAIIGVINDKRVLMSFLDEQRGEDILKALFKKIADADAVRIKIWERGKEDELCAYVSVYGSDDECLKLIKEYPDRLSDAVLNELKVKVCKDATRSAIDELQTKRLAAQIADLDGVTAVARLKQLPDAAKRSKLALEIIQGKMSAKRFCEVRWSDCIKAFAFLRDECEYSSLGENAKPVVDFVLMLKTLTKEDLGRLVSIIEDKAAKTIHFERYFAGMSIQEYFIASMVSKGKSYPEFSTNYKTCNIDVIAFKRQLRYQIFEKENGEFWSAYLRKYVPSQKNQKSLTETINDALDSSSFDYEDVWVEEREERCYIYKSMKYSTKVVYGKTSGTLALVEYK